MEYPVSSFNKDHTILDVGIHYEENDGIVTYDIRMFKPNSGVFLSPEASHTIEHYMANYLRKMFGSSIVYVGPMGCLTGFYILTRTSIDINDITKALLGLHKYINSTEEIPGATVESCGNYKYNDYAGACTVYNEFYKEVLSMYELKLYYNILRLKETYGGNVNEG